VDHFWKADFSGSLFVSKGGALLESAEAELPGSDWDLNFSEQNGTTTVRVSIYNESLARMEKMIEMGFSEGFKMTLNSLEDLLTQLSQPKETK
jgi:uncharacterized protein YndB with AHSA1/START domain